MTHVDWHPYPEEKPTKPGDYFVLFKDNTCESMFDVVSSANFDGTEFFAFNDDIEAWSEKDELHETYRPPEPEDNHPDAITARKYMSGDPETVKALSIFDE